MMDPILELATSSGQDEYRGRAQELVDDITVILIFLYIINTAFR